jgi:hypothetical protein
VQLGADRLKSCSDPAREWRKAGQPLRRPATSTGSGARPVQRCRPGFLTFLTFLAVVVRRAGADKTGRATRPQRGKTLETETLVAACLPLAMDCAELGMMPILVL